MDDVKVVSGVTNVYDSSEAKGFTDSEQYPIAWEIIFRNNKIGKQFAANIEITFSQLPKTEGYLLATKDKSSDSARCIECVFADKDAFRKVLHQVLPDLVIFDEQENQLMPKQKLLDATKILNLQPVMA